MANKDGVLSIGIEYKSELNKMIADLEGGLDTISKNNQLSKGMKQQFDNVIAEVRSFKATMEKELATLGSGKVDKTAFKSFKQTVANNFKSVREDIDRLDLAVSTLNSQMEIISKGVDLSKITKEFASFEDYVNRTNEAVSQLIDTLGQQGISLFSFDNRNLLDAKSKIKEIDDIISQLDNDKGAKFESFDEKEAQAELNRLSVQLRSTLELMEHTEKQMSNMDSSTVGFKKMQGDFALLQLKAASLNDTIEMLYTVTEDKGISSIEMDDKSFELYNKYTEDLSDNLESIVASAKNTKKELSTLLTSQKQHSVKVSSEMNPNSSELSTTVTIETTSSELWKKLSPVLTDLQGILNSNPVVAPVKLVVAPNAISSTENGDVGKVSNAYSKKYAKILAETGEDAVIDLEGVYKKTFTSIMDAGVSYAKETISKIQDIFDKSPINIKYDISQEEIDKIQNFVLSNKDGKKVDISGQITKAKQEVEELNTNIEKTSSLLQETQSKGNVKFEGFDKFTNDLSKSINKLEELQNILKALQNIEVTLAKASGLSSITEIESQWESLEKRIINATKVDGSFRKNASVSKIASEYQKYIDMGGTNSIADIDKIKDNKDTLDTIISKAKEFAKQDLSNDSVKELSIELDGIIGKFDELIATVKTATNALYKIIKQGNVSDLDKQWSSISNKFKSIADESGKINLRKQKTDIKELMDMYQKYENASGTNSLMSLTDNIETLHKLDKEYQKLNQTQSVDSSSTIEKESESFKNVEKSVNSLTTAIGDTKVQAINVEATAMEDASEREILAINAIVDNLNMIVSKLKEIKGIKIPKIQVESVTSTSPVETNISSENIAQIEEKIQDVGNGTKRIISEIGMSYDDFIKKVKSDNSLEERFAVFDRYGNVIESLKGDLNSLVLPDNMNTSGAAKIVHTHPSMNALGGTLSEDDYLQWYSKFLSKGIGEQFELLWRGKSLNIDLSNVREELRSSVIAALVNISHVAGLQLEKSDGEIPLPLSDIYNSLSNGLLKNSVEKSGGTVSTEILDETKNKVQNIEALISILDDFGNFRKINLDNDDAIVERIEQYKSVLKFLSEHEEYTYDQVQKILAYERMTIAGTNSQGLTHNGMQLKNDTAEWMSEYLADSYSKINNLSVNSSNFDPFNMSSDAERFYADITCKYYDAIAEAMDYVVRDALEGNVSENDFVSSAMSSITGEIGSLDDDEMLKAFLESKEHVQEYIQTRFDALKTSMDASPMIEVKKDEQSVEEQSKETANAIDEMIAKFSSTEIENMAKALTQCLRGLADFDEMAKSLGVTVDDLYTAQDIFNNKDLFNSLSETPIKDVLSNISSENSNKQLLEGEEIRKNLYQINSEIGLSEEEFIQKLRQENEEVKNGNRQFQERLALLKDGKVIASYFGDKASINVSKGTIGEDFDKAIHTHSPLEGSWAPSFEDLRLIFGNAKSDIKEFVLFWNSEMRSLQAPGDTSMFSMQKFFDALSLLSNDKNTYSSYINSYLSSIAEEAGWAYKQVDALNNELQQGRINPADWEIIQQTMQQVTNLHVSKNQEEEIATISERGKQLSNTFIQSNESAEKFEITVENLFNVLSSLWNKIESNPLKTNAFQTLRDELPSLSKDDINTVLYGDEMFYDANGDANELKQVAQKIYDNYYLPLINGAKELKSETNSPMKDVFQGNDKATTDSSTIAIKEESKALEQVSDSAKEASESKKKFSKSNKKVKASAESSSTSLNEEKAKLKEVGESAKQEAKAIQKLAEEKRKLRQQEKQSTQSSVDKALKDQISAWKQIQSIREKIAKTDDSKEIVNLQQIKKEYQEQYINAGKILKTNSELYNKEVQLARLEEIRLNTNKNIEKSKNKSINSRISSYKKELSKYTDSSKYTKDFVSRVRNQLDALGKIDITNEKDVDRLTAIGIEVKKIISDSKLLENKLVKKDSILADIISQMKIFRARNTSMSRTQTSELTSLIDYAEQLEKTGRDSAESIENIKKSYSGLRAKVSETGNEGLNMIDRISQRAQDMNAKFFAQFFSFQDWIRYLREGFNIINEIDTSITELRKVSNGTENDLKNALSDATSAAKELGSSISDIVSMQADWSRLGYSIPDAEELARATQLYVNVGDNMTAETASENLISTLQGFQLDASEAENIIDRFNEVANNYAIDTQGIGEALKRSAASFNAANTSLSESIALVTTANAVVQDPDSIGTTFKTLSARIRGAETELSELGEETDDYTKTTSKLRDLVKSLTGFDIMVDEDTFKSVYEILLGIGKEWKNLTDVEQASLGEALAGKRNANVLYSIMQNVDQLESVYKTAEESAGSAQREQENYEKSIQYSIDSTKASLEALVNDLSNSDFLKGLIDSGGSFLDILDSIIDKFNSVNSAITSLGGLLGEGNSTFGTLGAISGLLMNKAGIGERTMFQW